MTFAIAFLIAISQDGVNPDSALVAQFQNLITDYVKLTAKIKSELPPLRSTDSRTAVTEREASLARLIQQARPNAAQSDFFTPAIATEFRRLIRIALEGRRDARIHKSLQHAEPVEGQIKVNAAYPPMPLQSTPPTLLANLPELPQSLDYRIVGHTLVLRDVQANLVLDFIQKAVP
jgi:hypothetical protein